MSDSNFTFNRPYKPFGLNVKVPERTIQQAGETLEELVKSPAAPLFEFLEENEAVSSVGFTYRKAAVRLQPDGRLSVFLVRSGRCRAKRGFCRRVQIQVRQLRLYP